MKMVIFFPSKQLNKSPLKVLILEPRASSVLGKHCHEAETIAPIFLFIC